MTAVSVYVAQKEQILKKEFGNLGLLETDLKLLGRPLVKLLSVGFCGGMAAGALGLGGGVIYLPYFLSVGAAPKVASSNAAYLVCMASFARCFLYFINDDLDLYYGLWIGLWALVGATIGIMLTNWYM